jgi:segregation and condensation protein B
MLTPPAALEAVLFALGDEVRKADLTKLLNLSSKELEIGLKALKKDLAGRGLALVETEEEVELRSAPEAASILQKLWEEEFSRDLGKASLETLAIIAYRSHATRSEIDWVRGVNSSASLRTLLLRGLIEGEEDPEDKRRIRYRLTTDALAHLGIRSKEELPRFAELGPETEAIALQEGSEAA